MKSGRKSKLIEENYVEKEYKSHWPQVALKVHQEIKLARVLFPLRPVPHHDHLRSCTRDGPTPPVMTATSAAAAAATSPDLTSPASASATFSPSLPGARGELSVDALHDLGSPPPLTSLTFALCPLRST